MSSFKKLNTKIYQKSGPEITPDFVYWKKLEPPVLIKEFGPIDYVDFSPVEPHYFAVTCSVRVQVYNPITKLVVKNLSKFRECAYGAVFKSDGRLLAAGGAEACVKLFDVSTKSLLRLFRGHTAAIHRTFFVKDRPQLASFSDDKTVKLWDIPTEKQLISFSEHSDYVRAGATSPASPDIILAGGYDNIVKMYDSRTEKAVLTVNHGSPIESLLFLPSSGVFLSAGGTDIKLWDSIGGKLLGSLCQHHKTITSLCLASDNKRLLSGSLDRHVKIYDLVTFKVVHTLDYPNSVLSLGVSKDDNTVVAGMVDGLVAISRRKDEEKPQISKKKPSFQYTVNTHQSVELVIPELKYEKETKYDHHLRKFEYSKALESVLLPYVANKNPQVTVSVIQELIRRRALRKALEGRDSKFIVQILRFFLRNITDYRFTKILIDAANIFLDTYEDSVISMTAEIRNLVINLISLLDEEIRLSDELAGLQGGLHMLLSAASIDDVDQDGKHNLVPSADAEKNLVVNLT